VVDARRCISYHTIENRGEIPAEIQERMGQWVCGCDACQEVCPWNRFAHETTEPDFLPRPELANPDLDVWLAMDEQTFNRLTAGTPIRRVKYSGIQRNLRIATRNRTAMR
ncbi:MAG: tRNA epoxyqueuosine(34) reductase QueG, partial [Candidatus Hydrogenedentes bacterium]|nr:tRNA epoxyqueuosine(34) reductase QueG [Candidatus Hydrogenedentota bacterium]